MMLKTDSRPLDDLGDPHAEPGTRPWAVWVANEIRKALYDKQQSGTRLQSLTEAFKEREGYKPLGYPTWHDFCRRKLNTTPDKVEDETQLRLGAHGGDRRSQLNSSVIQGDNRHLEKRGSNSSPYLAARLARDNPAILEDVKRGKYRSMRSAAVAAGIIDEDKSRRYSLPTDPVKAAAYLRERVDDKWLKTFIDAL